MQLKIMKIGGNRRLRAFLNANNIPVNIDKKTVYLSNIMNYYRRMVGSIIIYIIYSQLRAESMNIEFKESQPKQENKFRVNSTEGFNLLKV